MLGETSGQTLSICCAPPTMHVDCPREMPSMVRRMGRHRPSQRCSKWGGWRRSHVPPRAFCPSGVPGLGNVVVPPAAAWKGANRPRREPCEPVIYSRTGFVRFRLHFCAFLFLRKIPSRLCSEESECNFGYWDFNGIAERTPHPPPKPCELGD